MTVTAEHPDADCHCETCDRWINHKGIMSHRAMHRRRNENCTIEYSTGRTTHHYFANPAEGGKPDRAPRNVSRPAGAPASHASEQAREA